MNSVKQVMLCAACAACIVLVPRSSGVDLKTYWSLDSADQERICKIVSHSNPDVVTRLQSIAERYVKQIQSDLAELGKSHPCLAGVGQAQIVVRGANEPENVLCGFQFQKNTHTAATVARIYQAPNKDGCILRVWVNNIIADPPWDPRGRASARFFVHEIGTLTHYILHLSEENNDLYKTVRALIKQRFKEMCDEMKKLQTAEDKAAEEDLVMPEDHVLKP